MGFLSRRMRDEHWDRFHRPSGPQRTSSLGDPDEDEIQPLLFDLIKIDKVAAVEALLPQFHKLPTAAQHEMRKLAARSGSLAMIQLIQPSFDTDKEFKDILVASIQGENIENLRWTLPILQRSDLLYGNSVSLEAILRSDSVEIYQEYENYALNQRCVDEESSVRLTTQTLVAERVFKATCGHPNREQFLLSLWGKLNVRKYLGMSLLGLALLSAAQSNCSIVFGKKLIEWGADVKYRTNGLCTTALHHAARQTSAEGAEWMKLLLFCGANPEVSRGRAKLSISNERGAKGISKWLHMSWDDLVSKAKEERAKIKMVENKLL